MGRLLDVCPTQAVGNLPDCAFRYPELPTYDLTAFAGGKGGSYLWDVLFSKFSKTMLGAMAHLPLFRRIFHVSFMRGRKEVGGIHAKFVIPTRAVVAKFHIVRQCTMGQIIRKSVSKPMLTMEKQSPIVMVSGANPKPTAMSAGCFINIGPKRLNGMPLAMMTGYKAGGLPLDAPLLAVTGSRDWYALTAPTFTQGQRALIPWVSQSTIMSHYKAERLPPYFLQRLVRPGRYFRRLATTALAELRGIKGKLHRMCYSIHDIASNQVISKPGL